MTASPAHPAVLAAVDRNLCRPALPTTRAEMAARGWDDVDVVFVTGDAYVDHPSFAMAILDRVLEAAGFRVAMLSQPDWHSCEPWRQFGRPRLFFAISAGNMDSLINHYTANKKVRNDDAYSPGGRIGLRPDRATLPYCHRAREAFPGVPVIAGGVEASLRRLAHYDYWSDTVRRSILLDCKADLRRLRHGRDDDRRDRPAAGGGQDGQATCATCAAWRMCWGRRNQPPCQPAAQARMRDSTRRSRCGLRDDFILLPSFEEVKADKLAFVEATRLIHINTNPFNAADAGAVPRPPGRRRQPAGACRSPRRRWTASTICPTRAGRIPSYTEPIPAYEMIKDSVTIMRGCFGGCTFCSITAHQGRIIQSRSQESVLKEVRKMAADPEFKGIISDIGGPTANMYQMRCTRPEVEAKCKRLSCVHPTICKLLGTDHGPLDRADAAVPAPSRASARCSSPAASAWTWPSSRRSTCSELAAHHVGGHLKVAPEHTDPHVLDLMKKPDNDNFERLRRRSSRRRRRRPASRSSTSCRTSSPAIPAATCTR